MRNNECTDVFKERHRETLALRGNYELLSGDVDEIKVKLKAV